LTRSGISSSTFSKNRHGRFQESNLFQQLFEEIVDRYIEAGFVEGEHLSVDGSLLPANASRLSRIPREQLPEAARVKRAVREYLADLEQENPIEEPAPQQDQVSTTDPDSPTPESRSTLCGIEEPDRTAQGALAENEACSRTVLSRGYSPKLETTGPLPKIEISRTNHGADLR
jgi:hypothetical protein